MIEGNKSSDDRADARIAHGREYVDAEGRQVPGIVKKKRTPIS